MFLPGNKSLAFFKHTYTHKGIVPNIWRKFMRCICMYVFGIIIFIQNVFLVNLNLHFSNYDSLDIHTSKCYFSHQRRFSQMHFNKAI